MMTVMVAVPAAVRGVRHDRDGQGDENEEERAVHTAPRSPGLHVVDAV